MNHRKYSLFRAAALVFLAGGASLQAATIVFSGTPVNNTVANNEQFTLGVNFTPGDSPEPQLYDFEFDIAFDPTVFQVLSANDGTIFGCTGCYFDGTIDNTGGTVTLQGGVDDFTGNYAGAAGLLGQFVFQAIALSPPSTISAQNIGLQSFDSALNLGGFDIDPGTAPSVDITVGTVDTTTAPEPSVILPMMLGLGILLAGYRRRSGHRHNA